MNRGGWGSSVISPWILRSRHLTLGRPVELLLRESPTGTGTKEQIFPWSHERTEMSSWSHCVDEASPGESQQKSCRKMQRKEREKGKERGREGRTKWMARGEHMLRVCPPLLITGKFGLDCCLVIKNPGFPSE